MKVDDFWCGRLVEINWLERSQKRICSTNANRTFVDSDMEHGWEVIHYSDEEWELHLQKVWVYIC